jgi:hypothetical protein
MPKYANELPVAGHLYVKIRPKSNPISEVCLCLFVPTVRRNRKEQKHDIKGIIRAGGAYLGESGAEGSNTKMLWQPVSGRENNG